MVERPIDDLGANVLVKIPCHLKDEIKSIFLINLEESIEDQINKIKKSLEKKISGCLFLIGADQSRYNNMKSTMQLNMVMGTNNYPHSLEERMNIMNTHQQAKNTVMGIEATKMVTTLR